MHEEDRVAPRPSEQFSSRGWTIDGAEALLGTLPGIISARLVARPGGQVDEIHLLTTEEISPKQTVRNVESALRAHYDIVLDHRKISVAQTRSRAAEPDRSASTSSPAPARPVTPLRAVETDARSVARIVFMGHQVESERAQRVRMKVNLEWDGGVFTGESAGPDLPRPRLETLASATLRAVEAVLVSARPPDAPAQGVVALDLDGVKSVEAFDRHFILVAVHGLFGRSVTALAGAAAVEDSAERAVILATLQATDRWVRGRL
jgi:hypothetical protein